VGHLCLAQEAWLRLGLDRVLLVPVREAPHRSLEADPGPEQRLRMVELATAGDERLEASRIEIDRPGTSYTVDTLRALRERAPADELTLILGADQALALPSWHEPVEVLQLARLAVAERGGTGRSEVAVALVDLGGASEVDGFDMPRVDVSSTLIRDRVRDGLPIRYLVPDRVADHIAAERLYADRSEVTA
jgi:nicotinate-nucleotide adenylyltransferase